MTAGLAELVGRGAVVTGAARGIGLAVAERLGSLGMAVVLADVDGPLAEQEADRLRTRGVTAHAAEVDVRDPTAMDSLAVRADELVGPVTVLVLNAGVVAMGPSWEIPLDEWHRVVDVNLWGVIHGIRAFVPSMVASGSAGAVVTIGSMASVVPHAHLSPYVASKHAVLGLSDALRAELAAAGAPIGVTVVMPGRIRTPMSPEGAPATTVADAVVRGLREGLAHVFTDPERMVEVEGRFDAIVRGGTPPT